MKYPSSFIDRVRNHFLVSEVVGQRIAVKKHGREFQALCPFHHEKSPSFTINDEKGFYHCFGCGAHGDAIGFIKTYENLHWTEALEQLARTAGIALPVMTKEKQAEIKRIESLYDVMDIAAGWFEAQLKQPAGREAREYLTRRGMREDTIRQFHLGFSPTSRDALKTHLQQQGVSEAQLLEAGLVIRPDTGTTYDRFRGRLMFPIKDASGRIVAFGGRVLAADAAPKYLNSPETPLFKKGELLYHFSDARKAASNSGQLIVAEGYMDVIALAQAGMIQAVAPLGTAVTAEQLQLMWRVVAEPTLCLDGDSAGKRAMARAAELAVPLLTPGHSLKFAVLPQGEDPDSLIRSQGREAMERALTEARGLADTLWDMAVQPDSYSTPEKKAALEKRLYLLTDKIADLTVRNYYKSHFRSRLWPANYKKDGKGSAPSFTQQTALHTPQRQRLEEQMIKTLLLHPALLGEMDIEESFATVEFVSAELSAIREVILREVRGDEAVTSRMLITALEKEGHKQRIDTLLKSLMVDVETQPEKAAAFWRQVTERYTQLKLREEQQLASNALATDMTEEAFQRFSELHKLAN